MTESPSQVVKKATVKKMVPNKPAASASSKVKPAATAAKASSEQATASKPVAKKADLSLVAQNAMQKKIQQNTGPRPTMIRRKTTSDAKPVPRMNPGGE